MTLQWPLFVLVYSFFILFSGSSAKSGGRGSSHSRSSSHSSHSSHSFHSSSTHYYGGYTVGHYRGGGHSSTHRSTHPTVSEKDVVDAIFTHSNQTFFTAADNGTFHYNETEMLNVNSTTERLSLYVSKPANPMWATADLAYYWGLEYLPNTESECITNVSEVERESCNETIDTCLRSISDIRMLATIDFFTRSNGSRLSQLTWHCPPNKRCCDWECCEEAILSTFESFVILIFVLAGICYLIRKAAER